MWALFYYHCSIDSDLSNLNKEVVKVGHDRIMRMLRLGKALQVFACADIATAATMIQSLITGRMIAIATENIPAKEFGSIAKQTSKACIAIAHARPITA